SFDQVTVPLACAAGLASSLSPCVMPLVPAYVAYLARQAGRDPAAVAAGPGAMSTPAALAPYQAPRLAVFASGLAFVAGLSLVFVTFFYAPSSLLIPFPTTLTPLA